MVYIYRAWIARIKEESSSLNTRFPDAIFLFIPNINFSFNTLTYWRSSGSDGLEIYKLSRHWVCGLEFLGVDH
jgi:hypothetical protein